MERSTFFIVVRKGSSGKNRRFNGLRDLHDCKKKSFRSFSVESVGYGSVSDGSDCEDAELLDDDHDPHLAQLRAPAEDTSAFSAQLLDDLAF